jgi:hypothetical protein
MKHIKPIFKLSILVTGLMVFITSVANAATYYSRVGATAANLVGSWTTNISGSGGVSPVNFTTAGDLFIIRAGLSMNTTAVWALTGSLQINATGSLTTGSNAAWAMTITGSTSISGTLTISGSATKTFTGDITVTNGGTWSIDNTSTAILAGNITVASGGLM